ncbi:MAG: protein kinase [Kofleriaceae bacterium]
MNNPERAGPCLTESTAVELLAGTLSAESSAEVDRHVDACPACRRILGMLARTRSGGGSFGHTPDGASDASSVHDPPLPRGTRVGRFRLIEPLGAGGMGIVYRAEDPDLARDVAVKLVRVAGAGLSREHASERLIQEAQLLARLDSPFVVTVHEAGRYGEDIYVALELLEGGTLREWLTTPRSWREVRDVFVMAAHGLAAAHDIGLVHRDFKLDNVLVTRSGRAKVTDFGLAKDRHAAGVTTAGTGAVLAEHGGDSALVGTPGYVAPEVLAGRASTPASDQYSFAASLYQALTGRLPSAMPSIDRPARAPRWLGTVLRRALDADAARRYPSMAALTDALQPGPSRIARSAWLAGATALSAIAAVALVRATDDRHEVDVCDTARQELAGLWSPGRRARLADRVRSLGPRGEQLADTVRSTVDDYTKQWTASRVESCTATASGGQRHTDALAEQNACLERARYGLEITLTAIEKATAKSVGAIPDLLGGLRSVYDCADAALFTDQAPVAASERARVEPVRRAVAALDAKLRMGEYEVVERELASLVPTARALAHPAAIAEALLLASEVDVRFGRYDQAVDHAYEALWEAEAASAHRHAVQIWTAIVRIESVRLGPRGRDVAGPVLARTMRHSEAALRRLRARSSKPHPDLDLRYDQQVAAASIVLGKYDEAAEAAERAIRHAEVIGGRYLQEIGNSSSARQDRGASRPFRGGRASVS